MIKKQNDFVKNWPSNSNLFFEKHWFSIIFYDEKLSVFNFYLKKLLRLHKNCIKIKNSSWQILQNGIFVFVNDRKENLSRFSCVDINLCYVVIDASTVRFLHYTPLYGNTQYYATLNCRIETRKCAGVA